MTRVFAPITRLAAAFGVVCGLMAGSVAAQEISDLIGADGLYVGGSGGVNFVSEGAAKWTSVPLTDNTKADINGTVDFAAGFAGRVAIGAIFGDFRTGFELDYGTMSIDGATGTNKSGAATPVNLTADVGRFTAGGNVFFDIPLAYGGVQPYIGLGAGWSLVSIGDVGGSVNGVPINVADASGNSQVTGRLMLGLQYPIDDQLTVTADYRYVDSADFGFTAGGGTINVGHSAHQIGFGLRWSFGAAADPAYPPPQRTDTAANTVTSNDGESLPAGLLAARPLDEGGGIDGGVLTVASTEGRIPPPDPATEDGAPPRHGARPAGGDTSRVANRPTLPPSREGRIGQAAVQPVGARGSMVGPRRGLPTPPSPLPSATAALIRTPVQTSRGWLPVPARPLSRPVVLEPVRGRLPWAPAAERPAPPPGSDRIGEDVQYGVYLGWFDSTAAARAYLVSLQRLPGHFPALEPERLYVRHAPAFDGGVYYLYAAKMTAQEAADVCLGLFVLAVTCAVQTFENIRPAAPPAGAQGVAAGDDGGGALDDTAAATSAGGSTAGGGETTDNGGPATAIPGLTADPPQAGGPRLGTIAPIRAPDASRRPERGDSGG